MRQAIDACMLGIDIDEYSKDHKELAIAIQHWGEKKLKGD
jgi:ribulose 1,5-bisphosphate carboxylase large subunit-like protein